MFSAWGVSNSRTGDFCSASGPMLEAGDEAEVFTAGEPGAGTEEAAAGADVGGGSRGAVAGAGGGSRGAVAGAGGGSRGAVAGAGGGSRGAVASAGGGSRGAVAGAGGGSRGAVAKGTGKPTTKGAVSTASNITSSNLIYLARVARVGMSNLLLLV